MRHKVIIAVAAGIGLTLAVWQGVRNASDARSNDGDRPEASPVWEPVDDPTFARWFPGYELRRTTRSCRDRRPDPDAPRPPASHAILAISPTGKQLLLEDVEGIEALFREADVQARNDDDLRDLAYLALLLLRRQHAELIIPPDAVIVLGPDDEIGNDPDVPVRGPVREMPVAAPLPDSDIFDKTSYEIEEHIDHSATIAGQRLTLGNRVFEVFVRFSADGRLDRIGVIDTGEIIAPDIWSEREFLLVEG
jgi:hypothetical protein